MTATEGADPARLARPQQLDSLSPDQLVAVVLQLAMEISVLRERLATHEALLADAGVLDRSAVDAYAPAGDEAARRNADRNALIESIIGVLRE